LFGVLCVADDLDVGVERFRNGLAKACAAYDRLQESKLS